MERGRYFETTRSTVLAFKFHPLILAFIGGFTRSNDSCSVLRVISLFLSILLHLLIKNSSARKICTPSPLLSVFSYIIFKMLRLIIFFKCNIHTICTKWIKEHVVLGSLQPRSSHPATQSPVPSPKATKVKRDFKHIYQQCPYRFFFYASGLEVVIKAAPGAFSPNSLTWRSVHEVLSHSLCRVPVCKATRVYELVPTNKHRCKYFQMFSVTMLCSNM